MKCEFTYHYSSKGRSAVAKAFWIISDRLGSGNDELGRLLMRNFVYSLARAETPPCRVMLMNGGVKLACEDSECLDDLKLLAAAGAVVKVCGTCLDYFHLTAKLAVGEVGNMAASAEVLSGDADVVTVG